MKNSTDDRPRGYLLSDAERARLKTLPSEPKPTVDMADKAASPPPPPQPVDHGPVAETILYHYHDADGQPHHQVQRRKYADGTKDFYPSHWNGQRYIKGVGDLPRIPYNAAEVAQATHIWFVEGEKCAESLKQYLQRAGKLMPGVAVTCVMGGVNGWKPELTEWFRDKHVCLIPDNDEAGYKFARKVGENLACVVASFQVRKWTADTPAKWDIADVLDQFLATGNGIPETPADADIFGVVFPTEQLEPPQPMDCLAEALPTQNSCDAEMQDSSTPPACPPRQTSEWRSQGSVTSQEIADAYIQHILQPENRNLCYTPDDKWWDYSPEDGWGVIDKKAVEPDVERFARWYMKAVHDHSDLPSYRLNSIMSHIQHVLTVTKRIGQKRQAGLDPSVFLTFGEEGVNVQSGAGWLSCHSHLLNVIPLAKYLAAKNRGQAPEGDLESLGLVRPADSSLFTKGKIPCAFDPTATCPRWMQFLEEACPEDVKQLQMFMGLTFTYLDLFPVFLIACGPAGTGKSIMMEMLEALHCGAVCNVSLGDFGEKFDEYPLTQHRVNLFADMESVFEGGTASKREAVLKLIAGKESKNTQDKYEKSAKRNLIAWCCFSTNSFPRFQESSSAIADRVRIMRFNQVFRGTDRQDPYLQEKLMAELPGILNWALIGLGELLLDGHRTFPESESAKAEKLEYIKSANPVLMFCDEYLERCGNWYGTETLVMQEKYGSSDKSVP